MVTEKYRFDLLADYHQFYVQDELAEGNLGDSWTPEATERLLALAPGTIGVGTVRNMQVPVEIEVRNGAPDEQLDGWDQVNECSIQVDSGRIVVAGCTDFFPNAARIVVRPGSYRVRVYYGKLNSLSPDGLEGEDHYRMVLWQRRFGPPFVLKQWSARGR
jgi:hypothetical protein